MRTYTHARKAPSLTRVEAVTCRHSVTAGCPAETCPRLGCTAKMCSCPPGDCATCWGRRRTLATLSDDELLIAAGPGATLDVIQYGTAMCAWCGIRGDDSIGPALEVTGEDIDLCQRCWWKANREDT